TPESRGRGLDANGAGTSPGLWLAMAVVVLPQTVLAAVQHSISALGPELTRAAGLPPEGIGLIGGLVHLGAVWFFAASASVIGPLGPVRALGAACLLSATAAGTMLLGSAAAILLAAPLVGFAYAATAPAGSAILASSTPRRLWGTLFSVRMAGVPAGGAIAGIVAVGLAAAHSWQAGLAAMALLPLACAAFLLIAGGPFKGAPEGQLRLGAILALGNLRRPFATLARLPALRRLTVASLGFAAAQGAAFTFLTTYLVDGVGLSLPVAGALFATLQIASVVGRIGVGMLADLLGDMLGGRLRVLVILAGASALGTLLTMTAGFGLPLPALFVGAALIGAVVATWNGLFLAEIAAVAPEAEVSEATSAATFFTFIAYMATPPIFALLAVLFGYEAAYVAAAIAVAAAGLHLARSS
ncbi:MAG: MFS transporter, partial [Pseudomonadota bacterium]